MAVIWSGDRNGVHYEVRSAGRTRRLYAGGVLHTQFNPARPLTGSVWDLLMLPVFMIPSGSVRRVLLLGVGGGAVVHLLRRYCRPERIVGVESDITHVRLAKRFFQLEAPGVELHTADARDWLSRYSGAPFDLIIDDLFDTSTGEPRRAIVADRGWFDGLLAKLNGGGVLVVNTSSRAELLESAYFTDRTVRDRFASAFELWGPLDDNRVGVFLRRGASRRKLRERLKRTPGLDPSRKTCRLRYRIRRLLL